MSETQEDFWLFGYGASQATSKAMFAAFGSAASAARRVSEDYGREQDREITAALQASEDHRGTPEAPGRVATLIDRAHWETLTDHHAYARAQQAQGNNLVTSLQHDAPAEKVWGAAYHIPASHAASVRDYLDIREINGYSIQYTPFHPAADNNTNEPIHCLVYIGLPENPQFMGPQDPQRLAEHIARSSGPSGENRDYLYQLEQALLGLSADSSDEHITDLARRCREVEATMTRRAGATTAEEGALRPDTVPVPTVVVGHPLHRVGSTEEQEEVEK
ncbi:hypothetical protein SLS58_007373 [Diplodia intermedia]|uniref:glutathione-specific gamma-glutamylcyclotransferase n=1 Tax=Diplodia intermedia TaxID=856260 RepID=A0ABR3TKA7_9PEZI